MATPAMNMPRIPQQDRLALSWLPLVVSASFQGHAKLNDFAVALIAPRYPLPENATLEKGKNFESAAASVKWAKLAGKRGHLPSIW